MTPLVFRPCACCRSSRGDGAKETAGRRVDAAESRPVMHPRDADSYCTSDVFTEAAAAAAAAVARDSARWTLAHWMMHRRRISQSATDCTL